MSAQSKKQRQLTPTEVALKHTQDMLREANQEKLFHVKTRFVGLLNAYKEDEEATGMLNLLMAEYALKSNTEIG